jgi:hypothetical protein
MNAFARLCMLMALVVPAVALAIPVGAASSDRTLDVLEGLAPFSLLTSTPAGRAALAANQYVTWDVQRGGRATLRPFADQQQQALRDAFITAANGLNLADGLGSGLGDAYRTIAGYESKDDGKAATPTGHLTAVEDLFVHALAVAGKDSGVAKSFFANGYSPNAPVECRATQVAGAAAILQRPGATVDTYGNAYLLPAGGANSTLGADPCGDSRPFQTDHRLVMYAGRDFWGERSGNALYLDGPAQDLRSSPAFPSGHTTYGYTEAVLFGILLPRRYASMIVRGAEYGNDRIVLGAHYAMDVLAGRTLALYDVAHLLANDARYLDQPVKGGTPIVDFQRAVGEARTQLESALAAACRRPNASCATDNGRFRDPNASAAFYESTQTYGLPVVNPTTAGAVEDVSAVAPEAGYLLTSAFPNLSLKQADDILTSTEGPGGGFLDTGSDFGLYSRINLHKAVIAAAQQTR